jgi:transcription elongation factor GreA
MRFIRKEVIKMAHEHLITQEGYNALLEKLKELKKLQAENIVAIQDARGQGDLSENADYDAAREQQAKLAAEIAELEANIRNAKIIDADQVNETSNLGKFVTVQFLDDDEDVQETYQIVGTVEADPINGKISSASPLGMAILTAKPGDVVTVRTEDGDRFDVKLVKVTLKPGKKK